jgi:hypothetical protein
LSTSSGDFGGLFGLFLGGSAKSVFEIFDLVIHIAAIQVAKRVKTRQVRPETQVNDVREVFPMDANPMEHVDSGSIKLANYE